MSVSNGHLPNSYEEGEDKPMLVVKKAGDGPGITALLNRQLQGNIYALLYCFRGEIGLFCIVHVLVMILIVDYVSNI